MTENKIKYLNEQLLEADEIISKLEDEDKKQKEYIEDLKKKCIEYSKKIINLDNIIVDMEQKNNNIQKDYDSTQILLSEFQVKTQQLEKDLSLMVQEKEKFKEKIKDLDYALLDINNSLLDMTNKNKELEETCINLSKNTNVSKILEKDIESQLTLYDELELCKKEDKNIDYIKKINDLEKEYKFRRVQVFALRISNVIYTGLVIYLLVALNT